MWKAAQGPFGTTLQSAMPKVTSGMGRTTGYNLMAVVMNVYAYDSDTPFTSAPNTLYVDVMCYGDLYNGRLNRVLWASPRSGLHEGPIDPPRPTTMDITGVLLDKSSGSNPANWDGDHVIIGFLDQNFSKPYVQTCIPHPSSDIGNSTRAIGHRLRVLEADGRPRFWKHQGSVFGLDNAGNWLVDLRRAHKGDYQSDGSEPDPELSGDRGNATVLLPEGSSFRVGITKSTQEAESHEADPDSETTYVEVQNNKVEVRIEGGSPLTFTLEGGDWTVHNTGDTTLNTDGKVHLGTGADHPVVHGDTYVADHEAFLDQLQTALSACKSLWSAFGTVMIDFDSAQVNPVPTPPTDPFVLALIPALSELLKAGATSPAVSDIQAGISGAGTLSGALSGELSDDVDAK